MSTIIAILIFIVAILLIFVIMVQNPKGGLASNFSSSNQVMGVRRTADFLEKATWTLGISLVVLSILSSTIGVSDEVVQVSTDSELTEEIQDIADPIQAPSLQQEIPVPGNQAPPKEE